MHATGELRIVPLDQGRFGGLQVIEATDDTAQVALLDVIWDCRPAVSAVREATATVQLRVPRGRLAESEPVGVAPAPAAEAVARVDAPLTALIAGLIATTI